MATFPWCGDLSMVMAMASLPTSLHCMRLAQSEPKASASALANGTVDLVKSLPSHFEEASGTAAALFVGFCNYLPTTCDLGAW